MATFRIGNLYETFQRLDTLVQKAASYELAEETERARQTYSTMLRFMVNGMNDPNSQHIYNTLRQQAYTIADRANRLIRLNGQPEDKYSLTFKYLRKGNNLQNLLIFLDTICEGITRLKRENETRDNKPPHDLDGLYYKHADAASTLFEHVWTSGLWSKSDYETANAIISADAIFTYDKALLTSAVTLALLEMFDERKLLFLFDAYLQGDIEVSQRAVVGIVLVLRAYDERIGHFPKLASRLSLQLEDPLFSDNIYNVLLQLQYSKLTENISAKVREEFFPSMREKAKQFLKKRGSKEIDDYLTQNGENPEWHHLEMDEKDEKKLQQMAEMQMDGADVYMSTFSYLKGYPFFSQIAHWFAPYDPDHPAVRQLYNSEASQLIPTLRLLRIIPLCNSDKYSYALTFAKAYEPTKNMIRPEVFEALEEEEKELPDMDKMAERTKASTVSRNYIFDLYRFFNRYQYHQQFSNPFKQDLPAFSPTATACLTPLLDMKEAMLTLAEFFMRKEFYGNANELFLLLNPKEVEDDADIWQRIGFCEQRQNKFEEAFRHYTIAYSLKPNSRWTLKHLAQVTFQLGNYEQAEIYYDMLLDDDGDNIKLISRKVECMIQQAHFDEALPLLYKATYLKEDDVQLKELLAWCLLQARKTEKSRSIYVNDLLPQSADVSTWMHAACAMMVAGDISSAYDYFHQAYILQKEKGDGGPTFKQQFVECARQLKPLGIEVRQCEMLYDAVRIGIKDDTNHTTNT